MKTRRWCWMMTGLAWTMVGMMWAVGWAEIPTVEERIRDSGLNPENSAWKAKSIRIWPMPDRKDPPPVACYRYDFTLSAKPRQANISLRPSLVDRPYTVTVNGQVVAKPLLPGKRGALRNLDITRYLRPGHNVFTFRGEKPLPGHGFHLIAEGIVFGEDGSILRLKTDDTWRGGWDLAVGWEKPETDPAALPMAGALHYAPDRTGINPPYYGPIQIAPVGMSQPIFDEEKPINLGVTLLNMTGPGKPAPTLTFEIMDESSRKNIGQGTVAVALAPKGKLDLTGRVRYGPLPAGAYRFRFTLTTGGEEVDRRDYEVACIGEIKQRLVEGTSYQEGMDLEEIWSVDCTQEPEPGMFIACDSMGNDVRTEVVEGPAGRYRILSDNRDLTFLAYRFKVKKLYAPHLVVIEWPDDAPRGILVQVYEPTGMFPEGAAHKVGGFQRGETAVVSIEDQPVRSNRMQKLHIIYWPNEEEAAIHVWNAWGFPPVPGYLAPAAVSRISVYEITNDLPALRVAEAGDRMIGYHSERANILPSVFYAGPVGAWFHHWSAGVDHPEFYRDWYTTAENMIKLMRFSGQNMYLLGHFMYTGVLYPSRRYMFEQNAYSGGDATRDYCGIILRMMERNGLSMISGIEYVHTADVLAAQSATMEQVIRDGAPTLHCISKDASLSTMHGISAWAGLNYFHPKVQDSLLTMVDELVELYKGYPAWKGISFILSRNFGPMIPLSGGAKDDPLYWGYEDYTIDLFQKETGIKIPVGARDPDRFGKRYEWLMANAKQKWIDWRCAQFTRLFCRMRDRLVKGRPDLKLYLLNSEPMNFTKGATDLNGHFDDPAFMKQVVKTFGFDPEALKKEPGMVIGYFYLAPGSGGALGQRHRVYLELLHNQSWHDLFANDGKGGAYIWSGIPHYGPQLPKGKWLFQMCPVRQGYLWPTFINDGFVNALVRSNPTWMPHTWMDVAASTGRLHDMRLFARAYRSLPDGKYKRLTSNGLDQNIWVERTRAKGAEYAYAANADWWEVDVTLTFAKGVKVHDLIEDQPVKLREGKWSFHLGPYEVRTFRITGAGSARQSAIRSAQSKIAEESRQAAESAMDQAVEQAREVVARAHAKEAEIRGLPGWQGVESLEQMIVQIEELKAAGDLSRAHQIAASWTLERAQEQVVEEALEAIPFLVLGPFGDPKYTASPPESWYEVVPEYQGMETPYLGESEKPDLSQLVLNFAPDLAKTYSVYPDKQTGWQEAVKARYLSFYGKCHSEHPLWMVAYAYTEIYSPKDRDAAIWVGSDHAVWLWVNGDQVVKHGGQGTHRGGQRPSAPDQNQGNCHLKKGWNRVLVKAVQRGLTRIFFRITDRNRQPLDDLRFRVPKVG